MIAEVTFTSAGRVRDVLHNLNTEGLDSLRPKYAVRKAPAPKFVAKQRAEIKKIALAGRVDIRRSRYLPRGRVCCRSWPEDQLVTTQELVSSSS